MVKNSVIKIAVITALILAGGLLLARFALATESCPSNTQVSGTQAILVGEITDDGGDPNMTVWFEYGHSTAYSNQTARFSQYGLGLFCTTVYSLEPCTTYHYRAVAQNSAGTSYGEDKSFNTQCAPVEVDLDANGSEGPVTINAHQYVNLSWTTQNAVTCQASGAWSGSKSTSGSQSIQLNNIQTYTFTLTCQNASGTQTNSDSVQVIVHATPPTVITKPAVVTY
jgi:hypothetical protein